MKVASGAFEGVYGVGSRMGNEKGTNPEELIGGGPCRLLLDGARRATHEGRFPPEKIHTTAKVHFDQKDGAWSINTIELDTEANIPNITPEAFQEQAATAKKTCPVSRALAGVEIRLTAKLL